MKKRLGASVVLLSAICVITLPCGPAWAAGLSFDPQDQQILLGQVAGVDILVSGLENNDLGSFEFIIDYDEAILDLHSYLLGTGLGDIGSGEAEDESLGDLGNGAIDLAGFSWLRDLSGQPDTFTLATVFFTGIQVGTSPLSFFHADLGDDLGDPITVIETAGGNITVADPVPEPATFFLLGIGILAAAGMRRKFKQ